MTDTPLDVFHAHEVLHTSHIIAELFIVRVAEHPFTLATPELRTAAAKLTVDLHDFYQLVGGYSAMRPDQAGR